MLKLTAKQKREVYSVSNLILHLAIFIILLLTLNSCTEAEGLPAANCGTPATVKDLRGLDGCGFVFVLADGTRLEPYLSASQQSALQNFDLADGQKVTITYTIREDVGSICMVGPVAEITCINKVTTTPSNAN